MFRWGLSKLGSSTQGELLSDKWEQYARTREAAGHCYQCLVDVFDRRGCKGVSAGSR